MTRALHSGTRLTVLPGFDAERGRRTVGATLVSLVATTLRRIDPSIFRTIVLGGSRPPADRPPNTVTTYGMTETGSGVVYDGVPLDGVEVRIDDERRDLAARADADALAIATGRVRSTPTDGCRRAISAAGSTTAGCTSTVVAAI